MTSLSRKTKIRNEVNGTLFTAAPVIGIIIFTFIPLIMAVMMSFMKMDSMNFENASFFDFSELFTNYKKVFTDPYFWKAFKNNAILFLELPISIIISVVIAELLSKKVRFTKAFKVLLFIPYVCSVTATTFMWNWLLDGNYGLVNKILGIDIQWFANEKYFVWAILIMGLWSTSGYRILLFTAAITNVNNSLKEAAKIDGASPIKVFFNVTIPSITPTIFYVLVMGMIGIFQEFTRIQVINNTGNKCMTVVFYIYNAAFAGTPDIGVACAASMILAILIFILTKLNFTFSKKWVNYDV